MAQKVKVIVPRLIVRSEPSPEGAILIELPEGTELEVVQRQLRYTRVRYLGESRTVEGWASTNMLSIGQFPEGRMMLCPVCQEDSWKALHAGVQTSLAFFAPVHLGKHEIFSADDSHLDLEARVCLGCGYVSWFVPPSEMRKL